MRVRETVGDNARGSDRSVSCIDVSFINASTCSSNMCSISDMTASLHQFSSMIGNIFDSSGSYHVKEYRPIRQGDYWRNVDRMAVLQLNNIGNT